MGSPNSTDKLDQLPEAVVDTEHKGLPVVWFLPLVALLVGGWLLYKTFSEKGPEVMISFQTAEGIEEGKTKIKYRDVTIGQVRTVRFADDLSRVLLTAELVPGMERHLSETTKFWVVRPRVGGGQITGLGTLISGAYIAMDPGAGGDARRSFKGLEKPPIVTSDVEGTSYRLRASKLGSLSVGSPVYFRQFVVGEVTEYHLAESHDHVDIGIFVRSPHDRFVRNGSRFWNVGGIDFSLDASGVNVEMESLVALMTGGIAFETSPGLSDSGIASEDKLFTLYESHAKAVEEPITKGFPFVLYFDESLRGLSVGAPVEMRGIRIGTVTAIEPRVGDDPGILRIPVRIDLEPERTLTEEEQASLDEEAMKERLYERAQALVEHGLRARLQSGNLLTGQLFVEFDVFPDAEPAQVNFEGEYPELPTLPGPLTGIATSVSRLLEQLEELPLEQTTRNLNELVVSLNAMVEAMDRQMPGMARDARQTLQAATQTLTALEGIASKDGEIGSQLYDTLRELQTAARSIRVMSEYLERHPEALLQGKDTTR
ncbi:MAG: MlaD family protein [Gammaproteobacteria bacterium]